MPTAPIATPRYNVPFNPVYAPEHAIQRSKAKGPLFCESVPYKEQNLPEFSCAVTLDLLYLGKEIGKIFDAAKPKGCNIQATVFYIDSTSLKEKTRIINWVSSNRANFPKGKVSFPYCKEIVIQVSNPIILPQPVIVEVRSDVAHFAAIFHHCCEITSGFYWTVNPAGVNVVGNTTYHTEDSYVTVVQNSNAYRSVTLIPTTCKITGSDNLSCSQNNIKQMFQSLGEEVTASCHGQKSVFLYETTHGLDNDTNNLVTIEVNHSPLDYWSYVGTVDDYCIDGKDVGCKSNITLRKAGISVSCGHRNL
ncbi:hypothetical protein TNCT_119521 [Trichonephila clavata]|uniref:Uncharacterized protein n=1 Tax=Trichonephila clavata TaxID=2740835 RepID=A0A8X6M1Q7_TRICU|nr:hypothetical protein TNCT_119521 [Trichonephila clavata]